MGKRIKAYKVTSLSKVNKTLYIEGDHFITKNSVGILVNGKIKTIGNTPDLSGYAKKTDIPDVSGLATKEEIPDVSGFLTSAEVQQMIDDAIAGGGGGV